MTETGCRNDWITRLRLVGICGLSLVFLATGMLLRVSPAIAAFGIDSVSTAATNEDGTPAYQAGSHPFSYSFAFSLNADSEGAPEGQLRSVVVDLPPGLIGNPRAVPSCSRAEFDGTPRCPTSSQVGLVRATAVGLGEITLPLYNLVPPRGYVASFGGSLQGNSFIELLEISGSGPRAHLRVTVPILPPAAGVTQVTQTIWGVPLDPGHDQERGECLQGGGTCQATGSPTPLLTLPVHCDGVPLTTIAVSSAEEPTRSLMATAAFLDQANYPRGLIGCDTLPFRPSLALDFARGALSPTGLKLDLRQELSDEPDASSAAAIREVHLDLPAGLVINPSAATGLEACWPGQIGLESAPGRPAIFDTAAPTCPDGSKIGSLSADLPAVGEALPGSVYLAAPEQNPYGTEFATYLVLEDPVRGLEIKIPGRLEANPESGRLTLAITDMTEIPFADFSLEVPSGPRALFATPEACGTYPGKAVITPSTAPEGAPVGVETRLTVGTGPGGGACLAPESTRPKSPSSFAAGTTRPAAGSFSPFVLRLRRSDLDQRLGSLDFRLPPGLVASLGSVPLGSPIGSVRALAGLGPEPAPLDGTAYLFGPWGGAPYSLKLLLPAKVGPFDLGTIMQRAAVEVDPVSARLSVNVDTLPQIFGGVPLKVRGIALDLDRPGFIRNPTSCEPMAITGTATTALGQMSPLVDRFQVGNCATLPFRPKLSLALSGAVGRGGHPAVRAVYRSDPEGAAPARIALGMPARELLDLRHLRELCPRRLAAERCPRESRLGSLRIETPMLDAPLQGPVVVRVPSRRLPDLSAEVRSGALRFVLHGRMTIRKGRFGVAFPAIPDIPLSRVVLGLPGGQRGLIVNSHSLCSGAGRAEVSLEAHSGKRRELRIRPRVEGRC